MPQDLPCSTLLDSVLQPLVWEVSDHLAFESMLEKWLIRSQMLNYALSSRKRKSITQSSKSAGRFVQQQDIPELFCRVCLKAISSLAKSKGRHKLQNSVGKPASDLACRAERLIFFFSPGFSLLKRNLFIGGMTFPATFLTCLQLGIRTWELCLLPSVFYGNKYPFMDLSLPGVF